MNLASRVAGSIFGQPELFHQVFNLNFEAFVLLSYFTFLHLEALNLVSCLLKLLLTLCKFRAHRLGRGVRSIKITLKVCNFTPQHLHYLFFLVELFFQLTYGFRRI